ncbi:MAG TPA: hypothetical protein VNO14_03700 [Blastocatellia bacterium]|nr:hypothetical protein [Blastocatellia bacterium]
MDLKLLDLRRYAIETRTVIRFADPDSGRECLIDVNGQVKIPGDDKDFRIEDVFAEARSFQLIGRGKTQSYARDQMAEIIGAALKKRAPAASPKEEE